METCTRSVLFCMMCVLWPTVFSSERRQGSHLKTIDSSSIRSQAGKVQSTKVIDDVSEDSLMHSLQPALLPFPVSGYPTNSHGLQYYHTSENSESETKVNPDENRKASHKIDVDYQSNLKHHRTTTTQKAPILAAVTPKAPVPPKLAIVQRPPLLVRATLPPRVSMPPRTTTKIPIVEITHKFSEHVDFEEDEEEYKPSKHMENKQNYIKSILIKLLEKSEDNKRFAEILPILKVMSPAQRVAMASLVTKQITADVKNPGMDLAQVKSMFGNNSNITADLMLPIMLDIANLFRTFKDVQKKREAAPRAQQLRALSGDSEGIADILARSVSQLARAPLLNRTRADKSHKARAAGGMSTEKPPPVEGTNSTAVDQLENSLNVSESSSNSTEDLPVAEKLRRNGPPIWARWPVGGARRPPVAPMGGPHRRHEEQPWPVMPGPHLCNLFTESLCLEASDYPIHAIAASIRKNPNAMSALHSDFPGISAESTIDGVSTKQENKYTPEHYLNNINRREDGLMKPSEASGFMCPSVVKYARPQKARATSGQWKYVVNTEEHTQTLRLEKCLSATGSATGQEWSGVLGGKTWNHNGQYVPHRDVVIAESVLFKILGFISTVRKPKESCTYLTDNFKSKCVQIYNYHRLLTWDNTNGLHMDIFKVPTCCSCHIDGYNYAFPPNIHKPKETLENFPGEDLSDSERNTYESVQHPVRRPPPKDIMSGLREYQESGIPPAYRQPNTHHKHKPSSYDPHFPNNKPFPGINDNFHADVFQQQESHIRNNIKKPPNTAILPSFLEPPTKSVNHVFLKSPDSNPKYKLIANAHNKRGTLGTQAINFKRPIRKPILKKTSQVEDQAVGASTIQETPTIINADTFDDINDALEDYETSSENLNEPKVRPLAPTPSSSMNQKNSKMPSTSEKPSPFSIKPDRGTAILKDISLNRRVNYNYHPIIDFFAEGQKEGSETSQAEDRKDTGSFAFIESEESDWRPMAGPIAFPLKAPPLS